MSEFFELFDIFDLYTIPVRSWFDQGLGWVVSEGRPIFQAMKQPVDYLLGALDDALRGVPHAIMLVFIFGIAWWIAGIRIAVFSVIAMAFVGFMGVWDLTMTSLAMVLTAVIICTIIGVPLGIAAAGSDRFEAVLRPVLDAMQTTPSFVYLIPVVMLFSTGTVSGVIATIIFAVAPIIRLTNLGIREVNREVVESARAFGATPRQILVDVQLPLALRTLMAGLNQTLMLALSMIVIASFIGAGGLGIPVRQGLNNLQIGLGMVGGLAIVLLAIVLDRITQALGTRRI